MDTARWKHPDEFPLLDLIAQFRFKSSTSLSFDLGTKSDILQLPDMEEPLRFPGIFNVIGWLDVHHPCEGFHRIQLRVGLPDSYVTWESMRDLVPQVLVALGLPADESYQVYLAGLSKATSIEWPQSGFVSYHGRD
jgi:hypothetical protein